MIRIFPIVCLFIGLVAASPSAAATIDATPFGSDGMQAIVVEGPIEPDDEANFADAALRIPQGQGVVILHSPGGSVAAAIAIGRAIRVKGFSTVVLDGSECLSACALAWLGGAQRFMTADGVIGFHQAFDSRNPDRGDPQANALVGSYLASIGLPDTAVWALTQAKPQEMWRLTPGAANEIGVTYSLLHRDGRAASSAPSQIDSHAGSPGDRPSVTADTNVIDRRRPELLDLQDPSNVQRLQRALSWLGFSVGSADGVWGARSRLALRDFKAINFLPINDAWDLQTQDALFSATARGAPPDYAAGSPADWTPGLFTPIAPPPGAQLHPLNVRDASAIQSRLTSLGFYRGEGNGIWGELSRTSLADFQNANGLYANGYWDAASEQRLFSGSVRDATATPFGVWAFERRFCSTLGAIQRMEVSSYRITFGDFDCRLEDPLWETGSAWRGRAICASPERPQFELEIGFSVVDGHLVDSSYLIGQSEHSPQLLVRCDG